MAMNLSTVPEDTGQQVTANCGLPNIHCLSNSVTRLRPAKRLRELSGCSSSAVNMFLLI